MAIKKEITFEGLKYTLDEKDRVAAAAGVYNAPVVITKNWVSGSGDASKNSNHAIFVADRTYNIKSCKLAVNTTGSAAATLDITIDGGAQHAGSGSSIWDTAQNIGSTFTPTAGVIGLNGGSFLVVTGSLSTSNALTISSSQVLSACWSSGIAGTTDFGGAVSIVLQPGEGQET